MYLYHLSSHIICLLICLACVNPSTAMLLNLNFQPLEVVSRYRDAQLQVAENYSYLLNLRPSICKT